LVCDVDKSAVTEQFLKVIGLASAAIVGSIDWQIINSEGMKS
jgi:hypothetical protein